PTKGDSFLFTRAEGGNEQFRIYRYDFATKEITALTEGGQRASAAQWNRKGDRIAYTTVPVDRNNPDKVLRTTLHVMDPVKPGSDKVLGTFDGGGWFGFRLSED